MILCSMCIHTAHSQFNNVQKGDIIDINGVNAMVFETSEDGHGTAICVKALRGKKNVWGENLKLFNSVEINPNENGQTVTNRIINHIKENNLDISKFPAFEWCIKLGDGWFIPSAKELESFINFYLGNDQEYDWEDDGETFEETTILSKSEINEKFLSAGGTPFLGNAIKGAIFKMGIFTSTLTENNKIMVYQFNESKNSFQFKEVSPTKLDEYIVGRAFYKF